MKKLVLMAVVALFGFTATAQGFGAGVNVGLPIGDAGDVASFNIGVDLNYLWEVSEDFAAGVTAGYSHNILKSEFDAFDDVQFVPIAVRGAYSASDFTIGADIGYGVGINAGNDGGFLWAPRVGDGISDSTDIVLSYNNISQDGSTWSTINLGVNFAL